MNSLKIIPKVSIVTVVYNNRLFIEDCIKSVLKQSYQNIEYIVIDGESTDGTVKIIDRYSEDINQWISERDDGIYDAMNKGIQKSTGDIIGILNSDDWYEKNTIKRVVDAFLLDDNLMLVHGSLRLWNKEGVAYNKTGNKYDKINRIYDAPFAHPTCFVKREIYQEIGLYDQSFSMAADYDFMLRFIEYNYKTKYIDEVLTNFRLGGVSSNPNLFFSELSEIRDILKKNNFTRIERSKAIVFRLVRKAFSLLFDYKILKILKVRAHNALFYK